MASECDFAIGSCTFYMMLILLVLALLPHSWVVSRAFLALFILISQIIGLGTLRIGCLHSVLDSNLLAEIWLFRGLLYKENMDKGVEKVMWAITAAVAPCLGASETIYFPNILLGFRSYLLNFGLENEVPMMSVHMALILVICVKGLWWNFSTLAKKGEKLVWNLG